MIDKIKVGTSVHSIVPVLSEYVWGNYPKNPLRLGTSTSNDLYGLTIAVGSGITTGSDGLYVDAQWPLVADQYGLRLELTPDYSGLAGDVYGLRVCVGAGLVLDSGGVRVALKDNGGLSSTAYGLALKLGSDLYTDRTESRNCSLALSYGLRLRLSQYTATTNDERTYIGNAITPTEYGLSLKVGTGLLVEQDALDVKLSLVTQLSGGGQIPNNAITVIPGEGQGAPGVTLKLQERVINGSSQTLLTTIDGGLDINVDALKTVLGLS